MTFTPPRPGIRIRPATAADVPAMVNIQYRAFQNGPISRAFYPSVEALTAAAVAHQEGNMLAQLNHPSGENRFVVAVLGAAAGPTEGGAEGEAEGKLAEPVVAYAKWVEYLEERPAEEWDRPMPVTREIVGPDADLEVFEAFIGGLREMRRREIKGRAHLILALLATSPSHQRLGAGSALVAWGLARADALNPSRAAATPPLRPLDCYLEASPAGYQVYARQGFEDVAVMDLDIAGRFGVVKTEAEVKDGRSWGTEWGKRVAQVELKEGWHRTVLMARKEIGIRDAHATALTMKDFDHDFQAT